MLRFGIKTAARAAAARGSTSAAAAAARGSIPRALFSSFPEHEVIAMPALSPTMEAGTIARWVLKEGEAITAGDVICEIETDKATVDFEAVDDGYLAKILVEAGSGEIKVGAPIGVSVEDEVDAGAFKSFTVEDAGDLPASAASPVEESPASASPEAPPPAPANPPPASVPSSSPGGRVFASPLARRAASERGIALDGVLGTGPNGRIIFANVDSMVGTMSASMSESSRQLAAALAQSKRDVPHYYLTAEVDVVELLGAVAEMNAKIGDGHPISLNDFVLKACALAMEDVPDANASWGEDSITRYARTDINVAVGGADGVSLPVLEDVTSKGIGAISRDSGDLHQKAAEGQLTAEDSRIGSFSVYNVGAFGVDAFAPIILPPQAAALGVGAIKRVVVPDVDSSVRIVDKLPVTLSCDHRVIDGAVGAQWLQAFRGRLSNPMSMLL